MMATDKSFQPLFICGFPSGGTDLLRTMLNAHREIYLNGEMPFLYLLPQYGYSSNSIINSRKGNEKFRKVISKIDTYRNFENIEHSDFSYPISVPELLRIYFSAKNKKVWGNKTPQNSEHIEDLFKIFPDAKFLIILRDVRDIALSWNKKWGKDMLFCADKWEYRMESMLQSVNKLGHDKYLIVKYEDILENTESELKKATDFLSLNWDSNMLEHHKHLTEFKDGKINFGKPLITNNKNKWKTGIKKSVLLRIEEISFTMLSQFNYQISLAERYSKISQKEKMIGRTKDIVSMFLVGNRFRSNQKLTDIFKDILFEIKKKIKGIKRA